MANATKERKHHMSRRPGLGGLTDGEVREIIELGESGATLAEIAARTTVSVGLVNTILMGAGVKPMLVRRKLRERRVAEIAAQRRERAQQVSPRDSQILARVLEGKNYEEIGAEIGLTRERVRQIIERHGWPKPSAVRREKRRNEERKIEENRVLVTGWLLDHPGATVDEIGSAVGLAPHDVEEATVPQVRHLVLVSGDRDGSRVRPHRWTRPEILDAIRRAAQTESPLSYARYDEIRVAHSIDGPSAIRILQIFDSWSAACREAGVQHGRRIRGTYTRRWTAEEMLDHLARFLRHSTTGSLDAYNAWSREHDAPGGQTIRQQFGSWGEARTRALLLLRALWTEQ